MIYFEEVAVKEKKKILKLFMCFHGLMRRIFNSVDLFVKYT